jgi:opacity protein-like surface antigen
MRLFEMNKGHMHSIFRALAGTALLGLGAGVAQAQQMPRDRSGDESEFSAYRWQVTPFAGYRMGGDFDLEGIDGQADLENHGSFALAVNLLIDDTSSYELFYSRQETSLESTSPLAPFDLNIDYLHLGGTLTVNDELPITPYIVGGLGLTRLDPQSGTGSEDTRFSVSLGGGLKMPITDHFGVRLEARGFLTFVNSDSAFFCASGDFGGVCAVRVKSDTLFQYELLAGASITF